MKTPTLLIVTGLLLVTALTTRAHDPAGATERAAGPTTRCDGESCDAVRRGLHAFFDRTPAGLSVNGRACADCHMPTHAFQLSPALVEARYRLLQWRRQWHAGSDDPLFRPIDADDFRINGDQANDFSNLRQNGLVRITMDLPVNIRLVDPATGLVSDETFVDVWRSVPTVNDVALTGADGGPAWPRGPNPAGGYQLDARLGTLQEQASAAFVNHAELDQPAPAALLDDLTAFQRSLFSNRRVRRLAAAVRSGASSLPETDPPLTPLQLQGKAVFERACTQCHGGPGQSTPVAPVVRYHDISSQCPRPVDTVTPARFTFEACAPGLVRNARTYEITLPNGSTMRRTTTDPGRALLTGVVGGPPAQDDWSKFDMPGLRGLSRTAPYFHNNSAATLEQMVDHYIEFFKRVEAVAPPGVVPPIATTDGVHFDRRPTVADRAALLAYLRTL